MSKMSKLNKIILAVVGVVVIGVLIYVAQYLIRFTFFRQYRDYLQDYSQYETGTEFKALSGGSSELSEFSLAAQNERFRLYINTTTCNVALEEIATKQVFYTNPYPLGDMQSEGTNSQLLYSHLQSQLLVDYYIESKPTLLMSYSSHGDCVGLELNEGEEPHFTIESITDGIRVIYMLGDTGTETGMVPKYLTKERYDEIVAKLTELGGTKLAKQGIRGRYVDSKDYKGYMQLNESNINPFTLGKMEDALTQIGYTMNDYYEDMRAVGAKVEEVTTITIPLEYRLVSDGMQTNIVTEKIEETGGAVIYDLTVLPFFSAVARDTEEGYFLVPNGSGALIDFDNNKMSSNMYYSEYVYGQDLLDQEEVIEDIAEDVKLPVFGIQRPESTLLVTLDNGQVFARVNAMTSKVTADNKLSNKYNQIYAEYRLRGYSSVPVDGQADPMSVIEEELYSTYLTQTYHVLPNTPEYDGYSGMAKYYRELLFANDESSDTSVITNEEEDIKLYVDLLGAVKRESSLLGFKYNEMLAMTTIAEAEEIVRELYEEDINRLIVNYQGWMNGGYYHDTVDNIKLVRKLGNKKELQALDKLIKDNGGALYGDVALQYISFAAEDYNYMAQSSRYYGKGYAASFGKIGPTTYSRTASLGYIANLYNLLSPKFLPKYVDYLIEEMEDIELSGISLRDFGTVLYSDKKRTEFITREASLNIALAMFDKLAATDKQLMLNNPLSYAVPYADDILNVPFYKNAYVYVDAEVPFYEMVLHGYVDYCGKVYNLNANITTVEECLELIEMGASPHFVFTHERSSEMKYTALNDHYSTQFATWKDTAVEMYRQVNQILRLVSNSTMDCHEMDGELTTITYSNGVVIEIDRTNNTVTVEKDNNETTYEF